MSNNNSNGEEDMLRDITVQELEEIKDAVIIDVRSEDEYKEGTIPGAVNVPLFNNEERAEIGEIYSKVSPKTAYKKGLEIASKKLPGLYRNIEDLTGKKPVVLFCWRGGMRSRSLAVVLDLMGLSIYRLVGGYKAYRRKIVDFFQREFPFHVVVIRGNTGVGKTELLNKLRNDGYPAVDLEKLSNNRGSVFGYIGLGIQPSQKMFESLLYEEIARLNNYPYIIVECESKRIGRITLPNSLYNAMQEGTQVLLFDTLDNRVNRLVKEYAAKPETIEEFKSSLERLKKRLGKEKINNYIKLLEERKFAEFAERLVTEYYDKLYGYPNCPSEEFDYCFLNSPEEIEKLKSYLDAKFDSLIMENKKMS